jgi:hypothetical protein
MNSGLKKKGDIIYSSHFIRSGYIQFKNIDFFWVTFNIEDSENITIAYSGFKYASYSGRMPGVLVEPDVTRIGNKACESSHHIIIIRNCEFFFTDGTGIHIEGKGNRKENCYFHHLEYSGVSRLDSA